MGKTPKYQEEILNRIPTYSNYTLLQVALNCARGDDYDGGFTISGIFEMNALVNELNLRLCHWLEGKQLEVIC